jgi:Spy/CpxP family protein refolding chaperone
MRICSRVTPCRAARRPTALCPSNVSTVGARCVSLVLGAVCVTMVPAMSFAGQSQWWNVPGVQRDLQLTNEQVAKIDAIFRSDLPERRRLAGEQEQLERRLEAMFCRGDVDDATALPLVDRVVAKQTERHVRRTQMLVRIYRVLTTRQRDALRRKIFSAAVPPVRRSC